MTVIGTVNRRGREPALIRLRRLSGCISVQVGSAGGDIGSRNVLVVLLGEQRPQHAGEHIARPRGAQPRRGAAGDDHTHMLLIIRESTLRIRLPIGVGRLAHVTAPLSSTVAPVSSWARNAQCNGSFCTSDASTSSPLAVSSEASSPACGVMTTCGGTSSGSRSRAPASTTSGGIS